jgi:hypothetical protein
VNHACTGRVVLLANIQEEIRGAIHPSNKKVVTMFLVDESFQKVSNKFLEVFTFFLTLIPLLHLLSKHQARVFCFYFAKKSQTESFLDIVGDSVTKIIRKSLAALPPYVDSDDEVEELVNSVRRVDIENEEPNKKAVDIEEPGKKADDIEEPNKNVYIEAEDVEDEDEYDPYSSMVESQLWPYALRP